MCVYIRKNVDCEKSFVAFFQPEIDGPLSASNDVWIEFTNKIQESKEFTVCHWINIKFHNFKYAACLWSYCTIQNPKDTMKCLRICMDGDKRSMNRYLNILAHIPSTDATLYPSVLAVPFKHRTWNHLCWTFSAINFESKFYHNGILLRKEVINTDGVEVALTDSSKTVSYTHLTLPTNREV